jgi:predicted nuclease of predicted toxin-antitoxin system
MRVYLDDNLASPNLARRLHKAGHDVQMPSERGLVGEEDPVHLAHAIREGRICFSENYADFENLHDLVLAAQGHHPGILIVRRDNDPNRDLKSVGIVRAFAKLLAAGAPVADQYIILNHWR